MLGQRNFAMKISGLIILFLTFLIYGCDEKNNIDETYVKEHSNPKYALNPTPDSNQPEGIYIPKDINDCFIELKLMLQPEFIKEIKE